MTTVLALMLMQVPGPPETSMAMGVYESLASGMSISGTITAEGAIWEVVPQTPPVPPTGPVVVGYGPSNQAFAMYADGSVTLPLMPVTPARLPPQDSNDYFVWSNRFIRAVCGRVTNGVPAPDPECATFKITVGK